MEGVLEHMDPEIARQMGFTSFGGAKRRKLANADDAVTDVQEGKQADASSASGANATPYVPYDDSHLPPGLGIYGTRVVKS